MRQGFRSIGGVPPSLSLWKDQFGSQNAEPMPELVLQVGHSDKLTGVAAPADGRLIITASLDSTVRVWSAREGSLLRMLPRRRLPSPKRNPTVVPSTDRGCGEGSAHRAARFGFPSRVRGVPGVGYLIHCAARGLPMAMAAARILTACIVIQPIP